MWQIVFSFGGLTLLWRLLARLMILGGGGGVGGAVREALKRTISGRAVIERDGGRILTLRR